MTDPFAKKMWRRVQSWFVQRSSHATVVFLPDEAGAPLAANDGYLRLWLAEGFLAQQRQWGAEQFPALHGGACLRFLGGQATFTTFSRTPEQWQVRGAQLDFPLTPLLPFTGGTVEVEAALYKASLQGPLGVAVDLFGAIAGLIGPPLSAAASIADKVSDGLDAVLGATGEDPVLGVHWTMVAAGGGGSALRPGHLVVIDTPSDQLKGAPVIVGGRLELSDGAASSPATGVDYLVVRVECRRERDDWRLPELDELIRSAGDAAIRGQRDVFDQRRTEALARAWNSADLVPADRKRVALLIRDELDGLGDFGAAAGRAESLAVAATKRLPDREDERLSQLTFAALLGR
jgi:hypothetical protein